MKREDLKVGNVIETREGEKYVIGVDHSRVNKVARYLNNEIMTLEYFNHLDEMYNNDLKAANDGITKLDIVKVYEDMRSLVVDDITPIWERSPLEDLEFDTPIWVKDYPHDCFVISLFKGIDKDGKVLAWNMEGNDAPFASWNFYKLFSMEDLKNGK